MISLSDSRNLPLTFTYDERGRLNHIQDASNRVLDITYASFSSNNTFHNVDQQGNVSDGSYQGYVSTDTNNLPIEWTPETVSDGIHQIGYVYTVNTNDFSLAVNLTQVLKADGKTLTYNYDNLSQYTGITDENGDRYTTYVYTQSQTDNSVQRTIQQTFHGQNHETVQYGGSTGQPGTMVMPNGQTMNYGVDANNLKLKTQNTPCSWCAGGLQMASVSYDAAGNPTSLTDFNGNKQTRVYDQARGVPTSITSAVGTSQEKTVTYQWDTRFLKPTYVTQPVALKTGTGSRTTEFDYDANGNMTYTSDTITGPNNFYSYYHHRYTYNAFGEVLTAQDELNNTTTFTYDTQGNLTSQTNALNQITTYGGYDAQGNLGWVQNPNGLTTQFTYDALQHVTQIKTGCDATSAPSTGTGPCHWETTTISYTPFEAVETMTAPSGRGLKYHYDTAHRVTQIDELDTQGNLLGSKVITLSESSQPTNVVYKNASGSTVQTKSYDYDNLNQLKSVIDSNSKVFGQTYDANGNLKSTTDPLSHSQTRLYDALNRLTQTTLADSNVEGVSYNPDNTVASQTDANGNATTYQYDGMGYVLEKFSPDSGHSSYQYDFAHNLILSANTGKGTHTAFDSLNRPTLRTVNSGESLTWVYDNCQNGIGKLCSITDHTGTTSFQYDRWGRLIQKQEALIGMNGTVTLTLGYSYDNAGQLTGITYPSGGVVTQGWSNGDVTSLKWNNTNLAGTLQYDAWHRLQGWTWPSGRQVTYSYDLDGRVSQTQHGSTSRAFTRDDAWRLGGINQTNPTLSLSYGYDVRDRLTASNTWGQYTYDNNSNRLTWLGGLGPLSYTMTPGTNNLMNYSGAQVATDARGFILQINPSPGITANGMTFTYDDWNRIRTMSYTGAYIYGVNGLGERVSKGKGTWTAPHTPVSQTFYMYDHIGHLMGVYDQNGQVIEELVYKGERPMVDVRNHGASLYSIETEPNMTPIRVLDSSNTVVWSWENHEPFGYSDPVEGVDSVTNAPFEFNLRFPGQYYDTESGLVSNGFRDYSPLLGRYMEIDPMGLGAGMNPYGYVGGSPLDYVDLDGQMQRNADGSLKANLSSYVPILLVHEGEGTRWSLGLQYKLYTDDGTEIDAFLNLNPQTRPEWTYDCHGMTFADSQYWVNDDQVAKIIQHDGYMHVDKSQAKVGDVVIYSNSVNGNDEIVHSATITNMSNGNIFVTGKGGVTFAPITTPIQNGFWDTIPSNGQISILRKK